MNVQTFVMMGRPGAGKGTQAKLLAEATGFDLFSSGEKTRSLATEDSVVGRKIKQMSEAGLLIPHWFASYLFEQVLLSREKEEGIIFDGMCRKLPEAALFEEVTAWLERSFRVIYLDVPEAEILSRLEMRLISQGRKDDSMDSLKRRLREFKEETEPALQYLRTHGHVIDVDGQGEPPLVFERIRAHIASL
ncbi:MAG TPA: nucleoside monophosphate kinase [Candidatus Paceibacterota bacterium]